MPDCKSHTFCLMMLFNLLFFANHFYSCIVSHRSHLISFSDVECTDVFAPRFVLKQ